MNFENIKLEKGMYAIENKSFSDVLEELDPSANYSGTPLEPLDAFTRQLKRFDIKVSGAASSPVHKFFDTTQSSALFPEYVSRAVVAGMKDADNLSAIVAATTKVSSLDYRAISARPGDEKDPLKVVAAGAQIPSTVMKTQENLVKLMKRGRMLVAPYEALKYQRLDLFTVTLRQIGAAIAKMQFSDAVNVLINGDGNNGAAAVINVAAAGKLTYADLISLWGALDPYELTTILASTDMMTAMLGIEEFKNPATGINFQGTGKMGSPLGANFIRAASAPQKTIIGLDSRTALEKVVASEVEIDYDRLIDRQLERAAITSIVGFSKIFPDSVKVLRA